MEYLRAFRITFYKDTNKTTTEKVFDIDDYESCEDLALDVMELINKIRDDGILEAF